MGGRRAGVKRGVHAMVECPYLVFGLAGPMSAEYFQPHSLQSTGTCQCVPLLKRRW